MASRRAAEKLILERRVRVNGRIVQELGKKVQPGQDKVEVDGGLVRPKRKVYVAMNKPPRFLCSRTDPLNRRTVLDLMPPEWDAVYPVGRLDYESEGLLFLTNDGDFALRLTHPRYGVKKIYEVIVDGPVPRPILAKFLAGVESDGDILKVTAVKVLMFNERHSLVRVELTEGKNREVRRLFAACGLEVLRLVRMQIGPIKLGELPDGKWRTLTQTEINSLLAPT